MVDSAIFWVRPVPDTLTSRDQRVTNRGACPDLGRKGAMMLAQSLFSPSSSTRCRGSLLLTDET